MADALKIFRLVDSYDVHLELGGELEEVRVELLQKRGVPRRFLVRLFRTTVVQALVGFDEDREQVEVEPTQVLEDFSELLDDADLDFEADDAEAAIERVFGALRRRMNEAAWAKN
jgi:hypothetical protein